MTEVKAGTPITCKACDWAGNLVEHRPPMNGPFVTQVEKTFLNELVFVTTYLSIRDRWAISQDCVYNSQSQRDSIHRVVRRHQARR